MSSTYSLVIKPDAGRIIRREREMPSGEPEPICLDCCADCGRILLRGSPFCSSCGQREISSVMYVPEVWATDAEACIHAVESILNANDEGEGPEESFEHLKTKIEDLVLRIGEPQTPQAYLDAMWKEPEPTTLQCCAECGKVRFDLASTCVFCEQPETIDVVYVPEIRSKRAEACIEGIATILSCGDVSSDWESARERIGVTIGEYRRLPVAAETDTPG